MHNNLAVIGDGTRFGEVKELCAMAKEKLYEARAILDQYDEITKKLHAIGWTQMPFCYGNYFNGFFFNPAGSEWPGGPCEITPAICDEVANDYPQGPLVGFEPLTNSRRKTDRQSFIRRFNYICQYCGLTGDEDTGPDGRTWHIDHVYAQSLGGDNRPDNLVLACATCNTKKNSRLLKTHLETICRE